MRVQLLERLGALSRSLPPSRTKSRIGRLCAYALGDPPVVKGHVAGLAFALRPAGRTTGSPFWNGEYDDHLIGLLASLTNSDTVFADIGANVGLVGLRIAAHIRRLAHGERHGKVLYFEPVLANINCLEAAIRWNNLDAYSQVFAVGLGDTRSSLPLVLEGRGGRSGTAVVKGAARFGSRVEATFLPLDECLDPATLPTVWKIDVDGYEVPLLRGALKTIAAAEPTIFGEFSGTHMAPHDTSILDAMALLQPWGYRAFAFVNDRSLVEVVPEIGRGDVLLVSDSRLPEVLRRTSDAGIEMRPTS